MARYEYDSQTPVQAQKDMVRAISLIADYDLTHPGRPITCRIVLDLPVPTPDYTPTDPA